MSLLFAYGTLAIPEVMEAVTGQVFASREATAHDFIRYLIRDRIYPGMTPAKGATASGQLYFGVGPATLKLLDEFEDEVYTRKLIPAQTQEGETFEAYSYIVTSEYRRILTSRPWCKDCFIANHLPEYLTSCRAFYRDVFLRFRST